MFEMFERFERLTKGGLVFALSFAFCLSLLADTAEIKVNLKLDGSDFVVGERIRGVVDIANPSPEIVGHGSFKIWSEPDQSGKKTLLKQISVHDRFFVEVYRASDMKQLDWIRDMPFVSDFYVASSEGQKLETFLGDHYGLREPSRYLAKPVLVHNGVRYEGAMRAFDVVEGIRLSSATQLFANHKGLQREFSLVYWSRNHGERLFLKAQDSGASSRCWETRDLGPILRIDRPSLSIQPSGEVVVLHRINQDQFVRSEFWSLPNELLFRVREAVRDPETAGTARVRELYKEGGIKPKTNPWWKFW